MTIPSQSKEQPAAKSAPQKRKLSYKEQRELDELPELIASLEEQQAELESKTGSANFFNGDPTRSAKPSSNSRKSASRLITHWSG